ncbi:MAG: CoA transferase [Dehalococcoidia bacterium]
MGGALAGLTVLECGTRLGAAVCGRLLTDLGADVLKIEPAIGDPARRAGPFPNDAPHPERSGLFAHLNRGKRGAVLDLDTEAGRAALRRLAARSAVLIAGATPAEIDRQGLGFSALAPINPALVCTAITPFGLTGPYRDHAASELVVTALSGVGYYVPGPVTDPAHEPPVQPGGQIAAFGAGVQAATATMVAVLAARAGGGGQQVEVAEQDVLLDTLRMYLSTWAYEGVNHPRDLARRPAGFGPPYWPCADGYVWGVPGAGAGEYAWLQIVDLMGNPEWAQEPQWLDAEFRRANADTIRAHVAAWTLGLPKATVADLLQQRHIPCMAVNSIEELLTDEQLRLRGAFVPLDHPDLPGALVPRFPIRMAEAGVIEDSAPAPKLGEHTAAALTAAGYDAAERDWLFRAGVAR